MQSSDCKSYINKDVLIIIKKSKNALCECLIVDILVDTTFVGDHVLDTNAMFQWALWDHNELKLLMFTF